jgi:hypothetical protein
MLHRDRNLLLAATPPRGGRLARRLPLGLYNRPGTLAPDMGAELEVRDMERRLMTRVFRGPWRREAHTEGKGVSARVTVHG